MRREKYGANAISDFHAISKRGMRGASSGEWIETEREREGGGPYIGREENVRAFGNISMCAADSIKVWIVSSRKRGTRGKKRSTTMPVSFAIGT